VDTPYSRFITDYVEPNRPVVISGAVPEWSSLRNWTPEFFKHQYGSRIVDVTYGVKERLDVVIDAVLASTKEKPGPYLHKVIIHQHMPELLPDLSPENLYAYPMRYCSPLMPRMWRRPDGYLKLLIGGVGGKFPLMHYDTDNANALITEIYGEKEFVIFSPNDTPYLYAPPNSKHTSPINDLDRPDLERFPLFSKATQYRSVIGPGEAIFIPSGWWHSARVVTTSISVCANMLHRANWRGFVDEACDPVSGRSRAVREAKGIVLTLAGAAMTVAENLQEKHPGTFVSRSLAAISPLTRDGTRQYQYPQA
jgi:hypothetical protein